MCTKIISLCTIIFLISQCESFHNPVLTGHDVSRPSVIRYNGSYFMVSINLDASDDGFLFPIYESTNLKNWTRVGYVFTPEVYPKWTSNNYSQAPSLHYNKATGDFIFLFFGSQVGYRIGLAQSKSIYGPYTPQSQPLEINIGTDQTFPSIMSYDGESYLLWCGANVVFAKKINLDTLTLSDEGAVVLVIPSLDWELNAVLAPRYIHRNNQHYISYTTSGGCAGLAHQFSAIGIAKSSSLLGPYTKLEHALVNTTLSNIWATGYGSIVNDPITSADVIVYGGITSGSDDCKPPEVNLNYIAWDSNGWPHVLTC